VAACVIVEITVDDSNNTNTTIYTVLLLDSQKTAEIKQRIRIIIKPPRIHATPASTSGTNVVVLLTYLSSCSTYLLTLL